jgi:fumarate hydratase class I
VETKSRPSAVPVAIDAIYEFEVVDMPVTVAVDSKGTRVHLPASRVR